MFSWALTRERGTYNVPGEVCCVSIQGIMSDRVWPRTLVIVEEYAGQKG